MKKPLKPLSNDCCGTGCRRCIYENYEEQNARYKQWLEKENKKIATLKSE